MTTAGSADADAFKDIFKPDSDIGADTAAPEAGQPRDDHGRFAPKSSDPEPKPEAPPPAPEAKQPASPEPKDDPASNRMVPLSELLAEREKRKSEARLREEAAARVSEYEQRMAAILAEQAQQQQYIQNQQRQLQQEPQQIPDPVTDPQGFFAYQQELIQRQIMNERANFSERLARKEHGDAAVDAALKAAPPSVRQRALNTPDPYGALMQWHKQASFLSEVGPDPSAYRTKLETEIRQKVLAELKAGGQQQQQTRFPGTLADATPTGPQGAHLTDEAVAKELFSTARNRRA